MKIEKLQIDDREHLLSRLTGRVFHVTTRLSYAKIQESEKICNNKSGCYPIYTGSQNSYGRLLGCVCLFDLRGNNSEIIQQALDCYYFLGPTWFSKHGRKHITWDLAYLFLDSKYYNRLIPNSIVHEHYRQTGKCLQAVPKSEVWIENSIPLSWIENVLLVKIKEPTPSRSTIAGMHYWAVINTDKKR